MYYISKKLRCKVLKAKIIVNACFSPVLKEKITHRLFQRGQCASGTYGQGGNCVKKWCVLVVVFFLFGCGGENTEMSRGLAFREKLLQADGCSFDAEITADFGDKIYTFVLNCQGNKDGSLSFAVQKPDTISGISGILSAEGGKITFDEDRAVAFPMLAEGEITPVSAPWVLYNTLRCGYIQACGVEGELLRLTIHDSYEEETMQVDVWLNDQNLPVSAEILWQGRRIVSIRVLNFQVL